MSGDYHHLPIQPASSSLASHLQALDLLAARLSSLSTRAEWETRVPLNSKASIKGSVINTANVKINIGGEWWVDMTTSEGEAWVRRRKEALLEEHAKVLEGWRPGMETASVKSKDISPAKKQSRFDPLFRAPAGASVIDSDTIRANDESPRTLNAVEQSIAVTTKTVAPPAPIVKSSRTVGDVQEVVEPVNAVAGPSKSAPAGLTPKSLAHALSEFMEKQNALAQASGSATMPTGSTQEAMINEEGLPIHEIREDENGKLLSDLPEPIGDVDVKEIKSAQVEEKDDFWSPAAVARREALRRRIFDDPSDSDSGSDVDDDEAEPPAIQSQSSPPSINAIPPTPSSPNASGNASIPLPTRRPSVNATAPKSILKSSAPRKKSVSFDSSIPELPSDSPVTRIGGSMFPTPVINIETMMEERTVPTLNAPKRSPKRSTFDSDPFAGFKPGFLGGRSSSSSTSSNSMVSEPATMATLEPIPIPAISEIAEIAQPRKSLFAQRLSEADTDDVTSPNFPAMSTSTHTSSVKNAIMERPTQVPPGITSRVATQSKSSGKSTTAGLASTVTERPIPGPSGSQAEPHVLEINEDEYHSDYDQDEDEDEEDDDFYRDDDEEEEYDLDDALLAREVALAYHQNRAYSQLGQQEARALRGDEDGPYLPDGYDDDEGGGGVMLALPKISMVPDGTTPGASMPSIINPTPDDLRRFVRVGKLDNGKLVLAPGESGWSDEEDEDSTTNAAASSSRARNKEDIRKALLGQGPVREVGERTQPASKADQGLDMPPTVGSSSTNRGEAAPEAPQLAPVDPSVASTTTAPSRVPETAAATPADPPKKVSRFKAARMG